MAARVTVAEVFGRHVALEWFEAVAIVRGVCECLERRGDSELALPELSEMAITSDGDVEVTDVNVLSEPIRKLGQLLQALLRVADPPATLRLVISEATAAPPVYTTLQEFDSALGYFERPDRRAVLRAVFERASVVLPDAPSVSPERLDEVAPLPTPATTKKEMRPQTKRRGVVIAVCAGLLLAIGMVAVQAIRGNAARREALSAATHRVTAQIDSKVLSSVSAVTEWAGLGKLVTDPTPSVAPVPPAAPKPPQRHRAVIAAAAGEQLPDAQAFDLQQVVVSAPVNSPLVEPAVLRALDPPPAPDMQVYSPADAAVRPPVAIRPQLPTELPPGVSIEQLTRIELVVASDGTVESVRLLPGARMATVNESMLLSAAKAWRFSAATKAGMPVRYRKTVWIQQL